MIWYALESSQSVGRWLTLLGYQLSQRSGAAEGSPVDRAVISVMIAIAIMVLMRRRIQWGAVISGNRWLIALLLYMLVSIAWSDFPDVSFKRWWRSVGDVLMALVVVTSAGPLDVECAVLRRSIYFNILLSIIFIKYVRSIGTAWDEFGNESWIGDTPQKNVLGEVAMTAAIVLTFDILRSWRKRPMAVCIYGGFLLMASWILKGPPASRSQTSIIVSCICLALLFGLWLIKSSIEYLGRYMLVSACVAAFVILSLQTYQAVSNDSLFSAALQVSGRDETLTGRTDLWSDLWAIAAAHPIVGVGYGSFWIDNTHNLWAKHLWRPTQGHNGYLDVFLELGAVGVALLIMTLVAGYRGVLGLLHRNYEQGLLHFLWITMVMFHNATESSYLRGSVDMWFMCLLGVINIPAASVPPRVVASSGLTAVSGISGPGRQWLTPRHTSSVASPRQSIRSNGR